MSTREQDVSQAFVSLANNLVDGADVVDLLTSLTADCARLLGIASAGLLLAGPDGKLHVAAASSERTRNLELFQLQREQGPCLDCYHAGAPVSVPDLQSEADRWPSFVAEAVKAGFASVHAVPMRLRDQRLGALGLFGTETGALSDADLNLGQALAHVASIAIVQDHVAADKDAVAAQLQRALSSRVHLEQAKGVLAQLGGLDMDEAFARLRRYARDHNLKLSEVAQAVASRALSGQTLLAYVPARSGGGN